MTTALVHAQAYTSAVVLATYPHQELMDNQQVTCQEVRVENQYRGVVAVTNGSSSVVIGSVSGYHHPNRSVSSYRQTCYPVVVRSMVTVGYKVTVRLPNGQNTLVHTRHEPPVGSVIYLSY
jgi:hypothetical protein